MTRIPLNQGEKSSGPFCQVSGCFEPADYCIILKGSEEPDYYEVSKESNYEKIGKCFDGGDFEEKEFEGFKMAIYFCGKHDSEFKCLIRGSELRIARRQDLRALEIRQGR